MTFNLIQGSEWAAELDLPWPAAAWTGTAERRLIDAGFDRVRVYKAADGKWYAEGRWPGADAVWTSLPDGIKRAWRTK